MSFIEYPYEPIEVVAADRTLTAADSYKTFTNNGARILTLPTLVSGMIFTFVVATGANYFRINAGGTQTIRYLASVTAAGGYMRSNTPGNTCTIVAINGAWICVTLNGVFTYDS